MTIDNQTKTTPNSWELQTDLDIACWIMHAIHCNENPDKSTIGVTIEMIHDHFKIRGYGEKITLEIIQRLCSVMSGNTIIHEKRNLISDTIVKGYNLTLTRR